MKSLNADLKLFIALFLPYTTIIRLKRINTEFRRLYSSYWFWLSKAVVDCNVRLEQLKELYYKPSYLYTLNAEQRYIRTLAYHDRVVQGSEQFLTLANCAKLALKTKDYSLFSYFHSKSSHDHNLLLAAHTDDVDFLVAHLRRASRLSPYTLDHVVAFQLYMAGRSDVLPTDYTAYQAVADFIETGDNSLVKEYSSNLVVKILIALGQDTLIDRLSEPAEEAIVAVYKLKQSIVNENKQEYLKACSRYSNYVILDPRVKSAIAKCKSIEIIENYLTRIDNFEVMQRNDCYQSLYAIASKDTSCPLHKMLVERTNMMPSYNMELLLEQLPALYIYLSNNQRLEDLNAREPHSYFIDYNPENIDLLLHKTAEPFKTKLLKWKVAVDAKRRSQATIDYDSNVGHSPL